MAIDSAYGVLFEQAKMNATEYLETAKQEIDLIFGRGFSANNPALVDTFIKAASDDFNNSCLVVAIQEAYEKVSGSLDKLARNIAN